MGMFSFRRAKEREAAEKAASIPPVETPKPKRKSKLKETPDGNNHSSYGGSSERK